MKAIAALLLAASIAAAAEVKLPPPFATPSSTNRPRVIQRPAGVDLKVPQGFSIEVFAEGFEKPRFMTYGPGGEILISDSADKGTVYVMKPEPRKALITGLYRPFGLAFWKDYLYVAEPGSLKRYKYNAKTMSVGKGEEVVSMKGFEKGHWTRSILFDRDGRKMYLSVGSGSNVDTGEDPRRATISRYNPDGSGEEIFASGLRNVIGLRWYPGTETLWAAVQERDGLGDDLVPDYFTAIKQGGFYGWPYAYVGSNEDPRNKGKNPEAVKKTIVPDVLLGAHVAVLDHIFYTGKQFPAEYQGGAFLAYHGSWNRSKRVGQSIHFLPFKNGRPVGQPREFLTGWMLGPDKVEVWGRPVGLLQMTDGGLLVSDDGGNKVWRISYKGK
ncbi:MAG: PQQ-dependent sugar dehydrogenase [Bryobacteraceae bacterium]